MCSLWKFSIGEGCVAAKEVFFTLLKEPLEIFLAWAKIKRTEFLTVTNGMSTAIVYGDFIHSGPSH
jgi:hypothetical protein